MSLTMGGISALALVIALTFMFKKIAKRTTVYLMLVAGLAGFGGLLGSLIDRAVGSAVGGATSATDRLFGTAVGGLVVVAIMTIAMWPHIKPKGQPPTRATPWIALMYGAVLTAVGGVFSQAAGIGGNFVAEGVNSVGDFLAAFIQGW